jgi:hypothetical protein
MAPAIAVPIAVAQRSLVRFISAIPHYILQIRFADSAKGSKSSTAFMGFLNATATGLLAPGLGPQAIKVADGTRGEPKSIAIVVRSCQP